jgi:predicted TIM-barrel fold metal-dependent hydrolase
VVASKWNELSRYLIVSSDAHCGGTLDEYRQYLPSQWHDDFDAWRTSHEDPWASVASKGSRGKWDGDERMSEMDAEGIAAEVLFPNTVPPFFPSRNLYINMPSTDDEYIHRFAGVQAHNRWLKDFCDEAPARRGGLAQVFLNVPDDTVREIRWAREVGMLGVLVPSIMPNHPTAPPLWHARYDPIWAACQDLEMVVNFHAGGGMPDVGHDAVGALVMVTEMQFYTRRSLWHLIWGGVFERFPRLKVVFTETGTDWIAPALAGLDNFYQPTKSGASTFTRWGSSGIDRLSLSPSGYFARNVWIGASFMPLCSVDGRKSLGVDRLMWGHDYPHDEGTAPYTLEALRHTFSGVPEAECREMLGGNAAHVYGFDLDALTPVARRVGPRVRDVHKPLEAIPEDSTSAAFMTCTSPFHG